MSGAETPTFPPGYAEENKGPVIIGITVAVTSLSTLFVALRIFVRGKLMGKLHADDYLTVAAVICGWAAVIFNIFCVNSGNGRHFPTLTPEQMSAAIFWTTVSFPPGIMSFAIPKIAVLVLLIRLLNPSRWHKVYLWTMVSICTGGLLGCVVFLFAQCKPSRALWDFTIKGDCTDHWMLVHYAIFAGAFSAFTDLYLAVWPSIVLFNLQMNIKKKMALSAALGLGSIATIVAIYKTTRIPGLASPDFSWDTSDLVIWTAIEGSTIIIASCIPLLQPLVDLFFGKRAAGSTDRKQYQNYGSDRSGNSKNADVEMGTGRRNNKKRMAEDTLASFATVHDKDSQEEILRPDVKEGFSTATRADDFVVPTVEQEHERPDGTTPRHPSGGIVRTDVVTVSYDSANKESKSRWRN